MDNETKITAIVTAGISVPIIALVVGIFATVYWYNQGQKELAKACVEKGQSWLQIGTGYQCVKGFDK